MKTHRSQGYTQQQILLGIIAVLSVIWWVTVPRDQQAPPVSEDERNVIVTLEAGTPSSTTQRAVVYQVLPKPTEEAHRAAITEDLSKSLPACNAKLARKLGVPTESIVEHLGTCEDAVEEFMEKLEASGW